MQTPSDGLRRSPRWPAPAEKKRRYLPAWRARGGGLDFVRKREGETIFVDRRMPDMAVEIAIRTFRQAKRPVHVNAEGVLFSLPRLRGHCVSAGQGKSPPA